jgi:hypothetical protein
LAVICWLSLSIRLAQKLFRASSLSKEQSLVKRPRTPFTPTNPLQEVDAPSAGHEKTVKMGVTRTRTVKNKHAANKSGISGSKATKSGPVDGVVKSKKKGPSGPPKPPKGKGVAALLKKKKKKVYTEKELGIPQLNMITPIGVEKPKGKKKGKVFVDDRVSARPFYFLHVLSCRLQPAPLMSRAHDALRQEISKPHTDTIFRYRRA